MNQLFYIAIGGAIGAVLRFTMSNGVHQLLGKGFPYGTLTVNVVGSLLIGFFYMVLNDRIAQSVELKAFLIIGVLGAFTTFSTFSMETITAIENREIFRAIINVISNVTICLLATWAGVLIGRAI